jgi:hypothetical protein
MPCTEASGSRDPRGDGAAPAQTTYEHRHDQLEHRNRRGERRHEQQHIESTRVSRPNGICANASGSVTNTSPGPPAGSRPCAKTIGKTAKPAQQRDAGIGKHGCDRDLLEIDVLPTIGRVCDHQSEPHADRKEAQAQRIERSARAHRMWIELEQKAQRGGEVAFDRRIGGEVRPSARENRHHDFAAAFDSSRRCRVPRSPLRSP